MPSPPGADAAEAVDPRIERSRSRVQRAALTELAERGYGGFTIDSVARRSGVARSTIYRHWPDKLALVASAIETLNVQPSPSTPPEAPLDRVRTILIHLVSAVYDTEIGRCIPALVEAASHHPELAEMLHRYSADRRRALTDAVDAGVDAGAFASTSDPDLAAQSLAGAVIYRRLMTGDRFGADEVDDLISLVLI